MRLFRSTKPQKVELWKPKGDQKYLRSPLKSTYSLTPSPISPPSPWGTFDTKKGSFSGVSWNLT